MKTELVIQMPKQIKNDLQTFDFLVNNFYNKIVNNKNSEIILDFKKTRWLEANMTSILGAIFEASFQNNNIIKLKSISNSIRKILLKNGFLPFYGIADEEVDIFHSTIKYKSFKESSNDEFQLYLLKTFLPKIRLNMSEEFKKEIRLNLEEIFQNARIHGQCKRIHVCGQYYHKQSCVKFTISNLGITIPENVNKVIKSSIENWEAIDWATKDGNSTKFDSSGGIGLYQLCEFIKENHGKIQILSNYGYWEQSDNNFNFSKLDNNFRGTIVNIEVKIDDHIYISCEERKILNSVINDIF